MRADPVPMLDLKHETTELRADLLAAFNRVLDSGQFVLGSEVAAFEAEAAALLGVKHAIGVNSGTDALTISLRALGIGPGDEVITSPFSFFATGECIALVGATPVFVDIEPESFNIDPGLIRAAITPRTKAILPVHLYGLPADMGRIMKVARDHDLFVIEDAAQSFGARWHGDPAAPYTGTIGHMSAFSFYPTKNLGAYGDAGMITTNDDELALLARKLRSHGSLVAYQNEMLGYNSRLDELQAAILRVKLPSLERMNRERRETARLYTEALAGKPGITAPATAPGHIYHQYTVRIERDRDSFREQLLAAGVSSSVYYPRLVNELLGMGPAADFPVARAAAGSVLSLPLPRRVEERERVIGALEGL